MTATDTIRVILIDDHEMVRIGLKISLDHDEVIEVIAEGSDGTDAIDLYKQHEPDIVLLDLVMPKMTGVEATQAIMAHDPNARIIALTSFDDDPIIHKAIEAGVMSYLLKDISMTELADAIHAAYQGDSTLAQEATRALMRAAQGDLLGHDITPAESRVLKLLTQGLSNAEIAQELVISKSTVKKHVSKILEKLDVSNRAEAAVVAVKHRLVNVEGRE